MRDPPGIEAIKLATLPEHRLNRSRCVVAGTKLVRDVAKRHKIHDLFMTKAAARDGLDEGIEATNRHIAYERVLRHASQLTVFDGLIGVVDMPPAATVAAGGGPTDLQLVLCLDHIEDLGLLGTLLRTALAFEWQAAFILPNCPDPFDVRVVRASQGALLDMPYFRGKVPELERLCRRSRIQLCVPHGRGADIGSPEYVPPERGVALLLREEHSAPWGPPRTATKIGVPDPFFGKGAGDVEPFDARALDVAVAGGVLLHHIRRFHYPELRSEAARAAVVRKPAELQGGRSDRLSGRLK